MHAYGLCWIGRGGTDRAPLAAISPLIEEREQFDEDGLPYADIGAGDHVNLDSTTGSFYY